MRSSSTMSGARALERGNRLARVEVNCETLVAGVFEEDLQGVEGDRFVIDQHDGGWRRTTLSPPAALGGATVDLFDRQSVGSFFLRPWGLPAMIRLLW